VTTIMFNRGNRKVRWMGDDGHVFGQKFPVRQCVVIQQPAASSFVTKARGKLLTHFHAVTLKCRNSMQN
jgi:hypothetical protein